MLKLSKILRDWDDTVQNLADLREEFAKQDERQQLLADENRILVAGLEGMAEELGRMRESLHKDEQQAETAPPKTVRRVASFREFAAAARLAGKKES